MPPILKDIAANFEIGQLYLLYINQLGIYDFYGSVADVIHPTNPLYLIIGFELFGLKENVIIGNLIPAGTGMKCYQEASFDVAEADEEDEIVYSTEE